MCDMQGFCCCCCNMQGFCCCCCNMQVGLFKIPGLISCTNLLLRSRRCISPIQTFGWIVIKDLHQQNCFSSAASKYYFQINQSWNIGQSQFFMLSLSSIWSKINISYFKHSVQISTFLSIKGQLHFYVFWNINSF